MISSFISFIYHVYCDKKQMEIPKSSIHNYEETVERPVYGYLLHNDEQRLGILEKYPNMPARELSMTITNSWKNLSEEKKNEYAEKAKELNWKCLSEYEKNAHLEHVKELATKLKEARHENPELNDNRPSKKSKRLSCHNESEYDEQESEEDESEMEDYSIYTQESYQYDSNTNSSSTTSINLSEQPSSAFAHYIIDNTPKMLQFYPEMNLESIKQVLLDNWNNMSPEQRVPWVTMAEQDHERYNRNSENFVSNTENNSEDDSHGSSDYDFDDLLNTEEDSEVDESNQSYIRELIHTYNNHKKSQRIEPTHTPSYFRSEPWVQSSKLNENSVENGDTSQCQSEVVFQKNLSVTEEIVPEHCSLLDTQLDVQSSPKETISADNYDYSLSPTQEEDKLTDQPVISKKKPLEIQFLIKPYNNENIHVSSSHENKRDPSSPKSTTPLQPRNMNQNELNRPRNIQQPQQERYGLKVPVPCIAACEHYQRAAKLDGKNKYGPQSRQTELNKSINDKWKQMALSERKVWEDIAKADKRRYEKEREEYLTSQYECFLKSHEGIPLNDWLVKFN